MAAPLAAFRGRNGQGRPSHLFPEASFGGTSMNQEVSLRIALGSDHAGFDLKEMVRNWLREDGHEVVDVGPVTFDPTDDYPDYARRVAEAVARGEVERGIIVCSTGQGSCMAANKVKGVRGCAMTCSAPG
jgi:ribose 5-phosphate isomerase RpiB